MDIIQSFYLHHDLTAIQIDSYNTFVTQNIANIVKSHAVNMAFGKHHMFTIQFDNVFIEKPYYFDSNRIRKKLYPQDARNQDLSYETSVICDVSLTLVEKKSSTIVSFQTYHNTEIFKLPVMVKSCLCNLMSTSLLMDEEKYNNGGYFIIKGKERVIVAQERINYNQVYVSKQRQKYKYIAEIRSVKESADYSVLLQVKLKNDDRIVVSIPYISQDIPLIIVLISMGVDEDFLYKSIDKTCVSYKYLRRELEQYSKMTKEECISYIGNYTLNKVEASRKIQYTTHIIENEIVPHLGICMDTHVKGIYVLRMAIKLIYTAEGKRPEDDRDHICNKRIEMVGDLMTNLINSLFKRSIKSIQQYIEKKNDVYKLEELNIMNIMNRCGITQRLYYCFTTGNWGLPKSNYIRQGVSQILNRQSYIGTISHLRRVVVPIGKESRNTQVRQINSTNFGFICPCECFDPETPILLWSGKHTLAKHIAVGDTLIGNDGCPTSVKSIVSGSGVMYKIEQHDNHFGNYIVTENHILVLWAKLHGLRTDNKVTIWEDMAYKDVSFTSIEEAIEFVATLRPITIKVSEYLALPNSIQEELCNYKSTLPIAWPTKGVLLDAYLLGGWLMGKRQTLRPFLKHVLQHYGLHTTIHIPHDYIVNDEEVRAQLMAGMIDYKGFVCENGYGLRVPKILLDDVVWLAQSLGCNTKVSGSVLLLTGTVFPTRIIQNEHIYTTPILGEFTITSQGIGDFVGWQLKENSLFLSIDGIVLSNSPEGQQVGIVKNFALMTHISKNIDTVYIMDIIDQWISTTRTFTITSMCMIFINGIWIGSIKKEDIDDFISMFRHLRDLHVIPNEVSIGFDDIDWEINISSDSGRIERPVLVVSKLDNSTVNVPITTLWDTLFDNGVVMYIDGNEAESSVIAMRTEDIDKDIHRYCEIHPTLMLGICSNTTLFLEHSQAPRNVYVAAMMKQAIGMYAHSYQKRYDTIAHVLDYPQKKLVTTKIAQYTHCEELPSGINAIVAIMCYTGFNQEDSIIINKSSIDRGLFTSMAYKTTSINENKKGTHDTEIICRPALHIQNKNYDYSKLTPEGLVTEGTHVVRNDVLVGKVYFNNDVAISDCSLLCKANEEGIVDSVYITTNASGYKHIKIRIRQHKIPEIGDKFCQVSAQKGTCGMVYNQEDMPFTGTGIVPDIIINPNAIPSRMTINMLLEMLSAKYGALHGEIRDATAFEHDGDELVEQLGDTLVSLGYERMGTELMYNGFTGKPFMTRIFIGPAYYQRLKHLVSSKMHFRSFGNVQLLNRQPCAGRAKEGGLRFGEMEKDCMIVHGDSFFLKERLYDMSDAFQIDTCPKCGFMVNTKDLCINCGNDATVTVHIPYACKLLFQELQAMGIKINIKSN